MSAASLEQIADQLSALTVMEAANLAKMLEEKWGVSAAAPVAVAATGGAAAVPVEEKTEFDVVLVSAGDKKINVIKVVRELTGLGLGEAKAVTEAGGKAILENVDKAKAEDAKKRLEAEGAKVEVK